MARGSKIYKVSLYITDLDRHCYEQQDLTVAQHPSESPQRLLARLIAFGLEYEPGLAFGGGISTRDEAPIWLRNVHDEVQHWIEIGQPDLERLGKLHKRHPRLTLYSYGANAGRWWQQHRDALEGLPRLKLVQLDSAAIEPLADALKGGFELQLNQQEGGLMLSLDDLQTQMQLQTLQPGWSG